MDRVNPGAGIVTAQSVQMSAAAGKTRGRKLGSVTGRTSRLCRTPAAVAGEGMRLPGHAAAGSPGGGMSNPGAHRRPVPLDVASVLCARARSGSRGARTYAPSG